MKKTIIIIITILLCASCMMLGCEDNTIFIASYNVDNLFDDIDNGTEYNEFDPGSGKWTHELYQKKLEATLKAIRSIPEMPDILCLQEIENRNVLDALKTGLGYQWAAAPPVSDSAVMVGILSRIPITRTAAHALPDFNGNPVRDILETELLIHDTPAIVFDCHWKSKSGGAAATEPARLFAAETLKHRIKTLLASRPGLHIIVAGDLNERHNEYDQVNRAYQTALLPPDAVTMESFTSAGIFQSDDRSNTGIKNGALVAYQPWYTVDTAPAGSYVYGKNWETIDHILLVGDFTAESTITFKEYFIHSAPVLVKEGSGFPRTWTVKSPDKGASDHLPVILELELKN